MSPTKAYNTSISGSVKITGPCTLQLVPLTLKNAPAKASIKLYANRQSDNAFSFPLSPSAVTGEFNNAAGPTFILTKDFVNATWTGLSFADFDKYDTII
jgi:hypothetical protein